MLWWRRSGGEMRVEIEYQDQFGSWKHFQTKDNEADASVLPHAEHKAQGRNTDCLVLTGLLDLISP